MAFRLHHALLLSSSLLLGACSKIERVRQCRALVATVNPALAGIQQLVATNRQDAAFYSDVAARYETLASELERMTLASAELKSLVEEYRTLLTESARAVRAVGQTRSNPQALPQAKLELERLVRREKVVVLKMDAQCAAH